MYHVYRCINYSLNLKSKFLLINIGGGSINYVFLFSILQNIRKTSKKISSTMKNIELIPKYI
jgi:hypothetical protein